MDYPQQRKRLVKWLRQNLIGYGSEVDVESNDFMLAETRPSDHFPTGLPPRPNSPINHTKTLLTFRVSRSTIDLEFGR